MFMFYCTSSIVVIVVNTSPCWSLNQQADQLIVIVYVACVRLASRHHLHLVYYLLRLLGVWAPSRLRGWDSNMLANVDSHPSPPHYGRGGCNVNNNINNNNHTYCCLWYVMWLSIVWLSIRSLSNKLDDLLEVGRNMAIDYVMCYA